MSVFHVALVDHRDFIILTLAFLLSLPQGDAFQLAKFLLLTFEVHPPDVFLAIFVLALKFFDHALFVDHGHLGSETIAFDLVSLGVGSGNRLMQHDGDVDHLGANLLQGNLLKGRAVRGILTLTGSC